MIIAGWPILIGVSQMGMEGQGMMCLSPVIAALRLADTVSMRTLQFRRFLWWTAFWDVECLRLSGPSPSKKAR